jgi:hypothetical protein
LKDNHRRRLKVKRQKRICHENQKPKKTEMGILISSAKHTSEMWKLLEIRRDIA